MTKKHWLLCFILSLNFLLAGCFWFGGGSGFSSSSSSNSNSSNGLSGSNNNSSQTGLKSAQSFADQLATFKGSYAPIITSTDNNSSPILGAVGDSVAITIDNTGKVTVGAYVFDANDSNMTNENRPADHTYRMTYTNADTSEYRQLDIFVYDDAIAAWNLIVGSSNAQMEQRPIPSKHTDLLQALQSEAPTLTVIKHDTAYNSGFLTTCEEMSITVIAGNDTTPSPWTIQSNGVFLAAYSRAWALYSENNGDKSLKIGDVFTIVQRSDAYWDFNGPLGDRITNDPAAIAAACP